jgi:lipopolysaccharide transport system ATP-binding protein
VFTAPPSPTRPAVTRVEVETSEPNGTHTHGRPLRVLVEITTPAAIRSATFSFNIVDAYMQPVVHMWVFDSQQPLCRAAGVYRLVCEIPRLRLYLGRYAITTHLSEGYGGRHFETIESICPFDVVMHGHNREWPWQEGACRYLEEGTWEIASEAVEAPCCEAQV